MARRVTKTNGSGATSGARQKPVKSKKHKLKDFCFSVREIVGSRRFRIATGIMMLAAVVMLSVAYVSYFSAGAADYSVVTFEGNRSEFRGEIQNTLGLPGAIAAHWLVDGTFGLTSIVALLVLAVYAARMMVEFPLRRWRLLFITLFFLVWSSIALSFTQYMTEKLDNFYRWGGAFGEMASVWLMSYVQWVGLLLLLIATLFVFCIFVDKNFVEHCSKVAVWIRKLFHRSKPVDDFEVDDFSDISTTPQVPNEPVFSEDFKMYDGFIEVVEDEPEEVPQEPEVVPEPIEQPQIEIEIVDPVPSDVPEEPVSTIESDINISVEEVKEVELSENDPEQLLRKLGPYDPRKDLEHYKFPSFNLLKAYDNETKPLYNPEEQQNNANRIVTTLRHYGIEIESIKATVGPTVTLYEIVPQAGVRVARIQNLENDIMLSLSAMGIRIIAPIPGKGTIGIEVPNENPQIVSMHSVIASKRFQEEQKMKLPISIGRTITNEVFTFDLAKTPHLLVAGATGQGKSVAINAIITSLLYKKHPAELKFVLVDPKMVEFAPYKPLLRHYLAATPDTDNDNIVIVDCDKVINTLNSLVIEMENRYKLLMDAGVRTLEDYNEKFISRRLNPEKVVADTLHHQYLPYIVIIIDEYGDFIMQAGKQVETPIARITQKARAVGMHMILATQRPSVNIVTGVIKANIPTRIALRTQSVVDSRTVLDTKGADQLIGRGDMLYSGNGTITRLQCAFVDTPEVDAIVEHIKKQQHYFEPYQLPEYVGEGGEGEALAPGSVDLKRLDPMFADVARYVVTKQEGSTSRLQRAFEIGYNRAGKLSDQLEAAGIVGPNKGPKGRDVLIQSLDELDKILQDLGC